MKIGFSKRITAFLLIVAMISAVGITGAAEIPDNFYQSNIYDESVFSDVNQGDWYYYYVGFAYEYGIMTGSAESTFNPSGNITVAEAITVSARLNAQYYGNTIRTYSAGPWYMPYLEYAAEQGIITATEFSGTYNDIATREQVAYLLYNAMPSYYSKINDITPLPDVDSSNVYYGQILSLYEAGIITGSDEYGTFNPQTAIQRSEVAAMTSRAVNTDLRVYFTLNTNPPYKTVYCSWSYPYGSRKTYYVTISISYLDYKYYASKPRIIMHSVNDYVLYAKDDADVTSLTALAQSLKSLAEENGFTSSYDIAGFVTAFVQNLEYQDDYVYKGVLEYPKYPIETLYDHGGDCEDTAALLAKLLKLLGYETVLLVSDDHMAVGLRTSSDGNITYNGISYYYIEVTTAGWKIGEVPDDMAGVPLTLLYV